MGRASNDGTGSGGGGSPANGAIGCDGAKTGAGIGVRPGPSCVVAAPGPVPGTSGKGGSGCKPAGKSGGRLLAADAASGMVDSPGGDGGTDSGTTVAGGPPTPLGGDCGDRGRTCAWTSGWRIGPVSSAGRA